MNCSETQSKNFFAALCYANKNIAMFEKQLIDVPEKQLPNILLSSVIFENCGLAQIKEYVPEIVKSSNAWWVPIPNQYILRDPAWLYPVIRACDPDRRTFTGLNYGSDIIENIRACSGIPLRYKEEEVIVDLKYCSQMLAYVIAHPELVGLTKPEMNHVMINVLTENIFRMIQHVPINNFTVATTTASQDDDLFQGLKASAFMIALFVSSCLMIGYYCTSK